MLKLICWYWLCRTRITHKVTKNYKKSFYHRNYDQYLKSKRWADIKSSAISAMQCKCEFCYSKPVLVHHIFYPSKGNYGYEGIASLIVVCDECHKVLHGKLSKKTEALCPLCRRNNSEIALHINLKHYELTNQSVCNNCYQIAIGKRYKAGNSSLIQYLKFVRNWQLTLWNKF